MKRIVQTALVAISLLGTSHALAQNNLSRKFEALVKTGTRPSVPALRQFRVLLVPGFVNASLRDSSGTYQDQMTAMRRLGLKAGLDFHMLTERDGYNGIAILEEGREGIASAIRKSDRPVLIISQSKGSVAVLSALLAHPELAARVRGWFSIQGAFGGSPIADGVEASSDRAGVHWLLAQLGGSGRALVELTRSVRQHELQQNRREIARVLRSTRVVTYASYQDPAQLPWALQQLGDRWCGDVCARVATDGVVVSTDEFLPGARYIIAPRVDHSDTTMTTSSFDRISFTYAILALMLGL